MEFFGASILIVDDDPDIREVLKDRLESLGYRILLAANAKNGLELVEKNGAHMVLLDIELPDMNGLAFLKEIEKKQVDVTVVMITAYATIERAAQSTGCRCLPCAD